MYRKDLFAKAGLTMPERPTWDFIKTAAAKITDKKDEIYGICLRGKAGWGENMAFLTTMANSYGARWFNEKWKPRVHRSGMEDDARDLSRPDEELWSARRLVQRVQREPGTVPVAASAACGSTRRWRPRSSATRSSRRSPTRSAFAPAPCGTTCKNANWLWAWALAIPSSSKKQDAAEKFIAWATGKEYIDLVAAKDGWANVPPGTRKSLYANPGLPQGRARSPK